MRYNNILLISDLHFDDGFSSEYKWRIFNKIKSIYKETQFDALFILGDLTDKKDRHSGGLVNRIVNELVALDVPIWILRGNHDGLDPNFPYFDFLNHIPKIKFIKEITVLEDFERPIVFYPHDTSSQYIEVPNAISFFHETFRGTIFENGQVADSEELTLPEFGSLCFSGDIHEPQQIGDVIYIGSPYHTRFGDSFNPRVILLDIKQNTYKSILTNMPKKITLEISSVEEFEKQIDKFSNDMLRIQIKESDNGLKVFNHISEVRSNFPNIYTIQRIKEEALPFQPIKTAHHSHRELITTYSKTKEVEEVYSIKGVEIHENS